MNFPTVKAAAIASAKKSETDNTKNYDAFGASAQVAYASDAFSTNVAADFGMKKVATADEFKSDFDVAANVAVSVLTVDGYYNYGEKLLSAKVKADLNDLDVLCCQQVQDHQPQRNCRLIQPAFDSN